MASSNTGTNTAGGGLALRTTLPGSSTNTVTNATTNLSSSSSSSSSTSPNLGVPSYSLSALSTNKILKKGLLLKQGYVVRSWKERVFVLYNDRLAYYDPADIILPLGLTPSSSSSSSSSASAISNNAQNIPKDDANADEFLSATPKGILRLSDITNVLSLRNRGAFQISVVTSSSVNSSALLAVPSSSTSSTVPSNTGIDNGSNGNAGANITASLANEDSGDSTRDYMLVAATEGDKRSWIEAIQQALYAPTRIAEILQQAIFMQRNKQLCSREIQLIKEWLISGRPENVEKAARLLQKANTIPVLERGSDTIESLLIDFSLANTENDLLRIMKEMQKVFENEEPSEDLRIRLVETAVSHYTKASASNSTTASASGSTSSSSTINVSPSSKTVNRSNASSSSNSSGTSGSVWSPAVQEGFGFVLHTIAVTVNRNAAEQEEREERRRQRRARRVARQEARKAKEERKKAMLVNNESSQANVSSSSSSEASSRSSSDNEFVSTTESGENHVRSGSSSSDWSAIDTTNGPSQSSPSSTVKLVPSSRSRLRLQNSRNTSSVGKFTSQLLSRSSLFDTTANKPNPAATALSFMTSLTSTTSLNTSLSSTSTSVTVPGPTAAELAKELKEDTLFSDNYTLGEKLGEGAYSVVYRATHKKTGAGAAVKVAAKNRMNPNEATRLVEEVSVMSRLNHPHIVRLHAFYDEPEAYFIVTELMTGGELFDKIVHQATYSERAAQETVRTIVQAVAYMHSKQIAHRDLKPENILVSTMDERDAVIKIADMGFAKAVPKLSGLKTSCGTPSYVAPEILHGELYDTQVDMWSIGVITYILLCGYAPFASSNQTDLFRSIVAGRYYFDSPYWDNVSPKAKDFIRKLLITDPKARATAEDILKHPWLQGTVSNSELSSAVAQMRSFQQDRHAIIKKGELVKQGGIIRSWRRRIFILTSTTLEYFDTYEYMNANPPGNPTMVKPKGIINIKDITNITPLENTNNSVLLFGFPSVPSGSTTTTGATNTTSTSGGGSGTTTSTASTTTNAPSLFKVATSGGREYILAADNETVRSEWLIALSSTRQHGDLLRKAQWAYRGQHMEQVVALLKMAALWEELMTSGMNTTNNNNSNPSSGGGKDTNDTDSSVRNENVSVNGGAETASTDTAPISVKVQAALERETNKQNNNRSKAKHGTTNKESSSSGTKAKDSGTNTSSSTSSSSTSSTNAGSVIVTLKDEKISPISTVTPTGSTIISSTTTNSSEIPSISNGPESMRIPLHNELSALSSSIMVMNTHSTTTSTTVLTDDTLTNGSATNTTTNTTTMITDSLTNNLSNLSLAPSLRSTNQLSESSISSTVTGTTNTSGGIPLPSESSLASSPNDKRDTITTILSGHSTKGDNLSVSSGSTSSKSGGIAKRRNWIQAYEEGSSPRADEEEEEEE